MKKIELLLSAALLMSGVAACNVNVESPEIPGTPGPDARCWHVSIPAGFGAGPATKALEYDASNKKVLATFSATDQVYVYNKTKGALDANCLRPDSDGASVTLSGTLSGEYEAGDELELRYGSYFAFSGGVFDYEEQSGSFESLRDFGVATVSVTGVDEVNNSIATGNASFTSPYSIFRFTFVDMNTGDPIPIQFLWVRSAFGKLVFQDKPDGTKEYYGEIAEGAFPRETFRDNSTDPVWLALSYEAPATDPDTDYMMFQILDDVHKIVYDMVKPTDGKIVNGRFYTPTIGMMPLPKPEVTLTSSGNPVEPTMIAPLLYRVMADNYYTYENPGDDITVSGDEGGDKCLFKWTGSGATVMRFKGTAAGMPMVFECSTAPFIEHLRSGVLTLELDGNTSLFGAADKALVKLDRFSGDVAFRGNGTLSVTASNSIGTKGFSLADGAGNLAEGAPDVHASAGFILDVSAGTDNGDGTSTWTYRVRPEGTPAYSGLGGEEYWY